MKRFLFHGPKCDRVAKALGIARHAAVGLIECLLQIASEETPETGQIGLIDPDILCDILEWPRDRWLVLCRSLLQAGVLQTGLDRLQSSLRFADWERVRDDTATNVATGRNCRGWRAANSNSREPDVQAQRGQKPTGLQPSPEWSPPCTPHPKTPPRKGVNGFGVTLPPSSPSGPTGSDDPTRCSQLAFAEVESEAEVDPLAARRGQARSSWREAAAQRKTDGRIRPVLAYWHELYLARYGAAYLANWPRDAACVKRIPTSYSQDQIMLCLARYFELLPARKRASLAQFCRDIDRYVLIAAGPGESIDAEAERVLHELRGSFP